MVLWSHVWSKCVGAGAVSAVLRSVQPYGAYVQVVGGVGMHLVGEMWMAWVISVILAMM